MSDALSAATMRLVGYYEAGDIGAKQYFVTDIPGDLLSHVIYAFADVTATGDCVSVDAKDDGINFPQLVTLKATCCRHCGPNSTLKALRMAGTIC